MTSGCTLACGNLNENQFRATIDGLKDQADLRRERLFEPGLDGHHQRSDMLRGRDWLEWGEHVKQMKREGYLEPALKLVYEMMDTARNWPTWDTIPPGWYNEAAIILRKLKNHDAEARLMEEALREYPGDTRFTTRLEKAKAQSLKV